MVLECSAVIYNDKEREALREMVVKKLATSYADHRDTKTLFATYQGSDEEVINRLIAIFEKYSEHNITTIGRR